MATNFTGELIKELDKELQEIDFPNVTFAAPDINIRCPEWQTCNYSKCSHKKIHKPGINCFAKTPGSIRIPECPDCRVEGK